MQADKPLARHKKFYEGQKPFYNKHFPGTGTIAERFALHTI